MSKKIIDLDALSRFKSDYDDALEGGQVVPLITKEIATISPESGDTQETPFVLQGTGTANGTSSVDTGTVGKHIQKQGSVYCVNQKCIRGDFSSSTGWYTGGGGEISISNNKCVLTFTTTSNGYLGQTVSIPSGHKVLVLFNATRSSSSSKSYTISLRRRTLNTYITYSGSAFASSSKKMLYAILTTDNEIDRVLLYPEIAPAVPP